MPEILQVNKKTKEIKRIVVTENHYKLLMSRNHFKNGGTYLAPAEFGAYFGALPEPEQVKQPEPIKKLEPQKPDTSLQAADTLMATMGLKREEDKGMTDSESVQHVQKRLHELLGDQKNDEGETHKRMTDEDVAMFILQKELRYLESIVPGSPIDLQYEKPEPTPETAKPKRTRKTKKPE